MRKAMLLVLLLGCVALLGGCPRQTSCNILTAGMFFTFTVVEENGQAHATATFTVGNALGTQLTLGCGDDIVVNGVALQERRGLTIYYEAYMDPADTYEFVFTRPDKATYTSTVSAPPPITILTPVENTEISRAEAFDITWENNYPESPGIALFVGGPCIEGILDLDIGDNGLYTVNAGTLESVGIQQSCEVDVVMERALPGTLDAGLNGTIVARTRDETFFTTVE